MSAGKSYKFTGTKIRVQTGYQVDSPPHAISAISQAAEAVVTSAGINLDDGDVVRIRNVVGMTEVNDGVYVALENSTNTLNLADTDSTGYGAYVSGGVVDIATFSNFCELTSYNRTGGTSPQIDTTSLCSTAQEFVSGLPDFGTVQLDYKFAPLTAIQSAIQAAYEAGDTIAIQVELPNNGGLLVLLGTVTQTSEQAANGGIWTGSASFRITGRRVDIDLTA
jgi:hypothetical protein